jgi:hypothetical protein
MAFELWNGPLRVLANGLRTLEWPREPFLAADLAADAADFAADADGHVSLFLRQTSPLMRQTWPLMRHTRPLMRHTRPLMRNAIVSAMAHQQHTHLWGNKLSGRSCVLPL